MPIVKDKKKKPEITPQEQERIEKGNEFVQMREKLLSRGANKDEATAMAEQKQVQSQQEQEETDKGIMAEKNIGDIQGRQTEELQTIDEMKSISNQADTYTRLAAAGYITINQAANFVRASLGQQEETPEVSDVIGAVGEVNPLVKGGAMVVGAIGTISIGEFSLSSLFNPASKNIKNLQGDAGKLKTESQAILRNALVRSKNRPESDLNQAIASQRLIEDAIKVRYNNAEQSLKQSPSDVASGLDLMDAMSSDLRIVVENRQMLERYKATGNSAEIISVLGGIPAE